MQKSIAAAYAIAGTAIAVAIIVVTSSTVGLFGARQQFAASDAGTTSAAFSAAPAASGIDVGAGPVSALSIDAPADAGPRSHEDDEDDEDEEHERFEHDRSQRSSLRQLVRRDD